MRAIEPPPLATWILEHCIPGQRDDALAGDLLEVFQQGRTNGWYWRQALAAFAAGWWKYLGDRMLLIVFAALWSTLAPAWTAIIDRLQNRNVAWPVSVAAWLALNLAFIWAGMLLFIAFHRQHIVVLQKDKLRRAFAVAAAIFLPVYFLTFILTNLFAWPGLALNWRLVNPLSEIFDFGFIADVVRAPYFATILWSMWSSVRTLAPAPSPVIEWSGQRVPITREDAAQQDDIETFATMRMLALMLGAGLLNALIAAVLLCRLPEAHHPSLTSLCLRAAVFVLIGAAAGVMGTFLYWNNPASTFRHNPPLPFSLFALVCAAAWVWIPAMVLFSEQVSAFSACVAAVAALLVAGEVRRLMMQVTRHHEARPAFTAERAMFVETLSHSPANPAGYLVALCVYGAGLAIAGRSNMTAAALLATGAFLFKFSATTLPHQNFTREFAYRRAALRFAAVMIPAILVTAWALLDGVAQRNHLIALRAAGEGNGDSSAQHSKGTNTSHLGKGYESVVLWPYPPKKQIVAPIPEDSLLAPGTKQPVVIRFSGEYWYLQPPDNQPGADAHKAEGTPLDVNISSSNSFPLMMQAHQFLRPAVRLSRCREIRIDIADREDTAADIKASVWLKDSTAKERPSVYLGQLPIVASQKRSFGVGSPPAQVTLSFAVPLTDRKRKFDEITVMLVTDTAHQRVGPHVAIEQFEFIPR